MTNDRTTQLIKWIETACLWEAEAPKAGNVHPQASFVDLTYNDFVRSARVTAFMLSRIDQRGISKSILDAVKTVKLQIGKNTNLGIVLLIAPLAAASQVGEIEHHITQFIDGLDVADSRLIFEAIRTAQPGGMGTTSEQDLSTEPTESVRQIMSLAADRDLIARQYSNNFADVLGFGRDRLKAWWERFPQDRNQAIVGLHLDWMATYPDSLIARKCGYEVAKESSIRAKQVLELNWPETAESCEEFAKLDDWLRDDGHQKNPGTSADLVAATLFAGLREGMISN
ncbi:triphosphoribosyl-dephospho-CoA synthase [Rubinisphaera italica]|uniref:ATP:dephospho-CoA triphosphoribosyl transferase n=1 Tax=Rubinisphaera italica TaxID=2527969 RepID=A0A5C5XGD2_9PLAN|nr:triphosphoribosyl-dephospho-CoA synthase [Rubinisphaera italica]TWT61844.1 ATP:dephospho-CoA triphosphoribosyl transferase [Rubinisphaera italica]